MIKIILVGCGNMGNALLQGWQKANLISPESIVIDPKYTNIASDNINAYTSSQDIPDDFCPDIIIFAVKPNAILKIAAEYAHYTNALYISVAAGINCHTLSDSIGYDKAITRAMPNMPATIGESMTACYHNHKVTEQQCDMSQQLFEACGEVITLPEENLIHCATTISGSGSAYIFLMLEAMITAGEKLGMSRDIATASVLQTALGAAKMAKTSQTPPAMLRQYVTSPSGTTEAAMNIFLHDNQFMDLIANAMTAAHQRSIAIEEEK